ncbi:MAG: chemotaxis protein CheD [Leptospira sp.]|nr:chemotaxis protein CheD [Leptospira sp.]
MLSKESKIITVGIAEIKSGKTPDVLRTTLGSCLGIVLYNPETKSGAISHIMLAHDSLGKDSSKNPGKYGETALPLLLKTMEAEGNKPGSFGARIFGGASMFQGINSSFLQNIGENNIAIVKSFMLAKSIPILAEDIGGHEGRTISLYLDDGRILLKKSGTEKYLYKVK